MLADEPIRPRLSLPSFVKRVRPQARVFSNLLTVGRGQNTRQADEAA